jgi:hypothetical protein
LTEFVIAQQFRGPPNSGNGGYVAGVMAALIDGAATAVLRAPPPLDTPLVLKRDGGRVVMATPEGGLIGDASPATGVPFDAPPAPPSYAEAVAAGARFVGLTRLFHPVCFCCGDKLAEGYGLRVFVGQTEGAPAGHVSGPWTPLAPFVDAAGLATSEVIWAALDCPGSVSWVVTEGGGGLLGTMTCEITRRPKLGEACVVTAWPIEQSGRKRLSGTAMFTAEGELLAQSRQIWIGRPATPPA